MAVTLTEAAARHVNRYLSKRGKGIGVRLGVPRQKHASVQRLLQKQRLPKRLLRVQSQRRALQRKLPLRKRRPTKWVKK